MMILIIETFIGSNFSEPVLIIWQLHTNKRAIRSASAQYFLCALSKHQFPNISVYSSVADFSRPVYSYSGVSSKNDPQKWRILYIF
jgi:hypothetical protein